MTPDRPNRRARDVPWDDPATGPGDLPLGYGRSLTPDLLRKAYAAGVFLVSGRKIPRDGGIILALGPSRAEVEALMQHDPFVARGLAEVRVIEFRASQRAPDLDARMALEPAGPARRKR